MTTTIESGFGARLFVRGFLLNGMRRLRPIEFAGSGMSA